ncbi:MAG: hypothetical protein NC299_12080 [Lachnospiraceae bacterium]|nr:hypothetical protein [Ruminococcus sp.]MCM1276081.1 hypothetical protein [Lachnospiraceae bacterium]
MENNNEFYGQEPRLESGAAAVSEGTRSGEIAALYAQLDALKAELGAARVQITLLLMGIAKEKLEEGTSLAMGLCKAGIAPEDAAAEIISAYPHLKTVQRSIPQFSASGSGSDDGFSAIRRIFSGK